MSVKIPQTFCGSIHFSSQPVPTHPGPSGTRTAPPTLSVPRRAVQYTFQHKAARTKITFKGVLLLFSESPGFCPHKGCHSCVTDSSAPFNLVFCFHAALAGRQLSKGTASVSAASIVVMEKPRTGRQTLLTCREPENHQICRPIHKLPPPKTGFSLSENTHAHSRAQLSSHLSSVLLTKCTPRSAPTFC